MNLPRQIIGAMCTVAGMAGFADTAGCTKIEFVERDAIVINGKAYTEERLLYSLNEISYPPDEAAEPGLSVRVMADGAVISADIPLRLVGTKIDLSRRNAAPTVGSLYFTFHISTRGERAEYYRVQSWGTDEEKETSTIPYGGEFSISRGDEPGNWTFEWTLTDRKNGKTISTGYLKKPFTKI